MSDGTPHCSKLPIRLMTVVAVGVDLVSNSDDVPSVTVGGVIVGPAVVGGVVPSAPVTPVVGGGKSVPGPTI